MSILVLGKNNSIVLLSFRSFSDIIDFSNLGRVEYYKKLTLAEQTQRCHVILIFSLASSAILKTQHWFQFYEVFNWRSI